MERGPLLCPVCGASYAEGERVCEACGVPLAFPEALAGPAELPVSERRRRARKIKPQYAEGALVKVARAQSQPEAELIQGLLLNEGVPSLLRRSEGADVPDFLAAGPRDVMVPESGAATAREALRAPPQTRTG